MLRQLTVFAASSCALPYLFAKGSGHESSCGIGRMQNDACLGVQEVQELSYAKVFLKQNPLLCRNLSAIVLLQEPANFCGSSSIKAELEKFASRVRGQAGRCGSNDFLQDIGFGDRGRRRHSSDVTTLNSQQPQRRCSP